ncbi:MAG: methionine--tRNA ligase subunit beta [Candidatus Micrarchaeota archaeon]|nr:methionine--tRNA ligase subunit beta [Candidatus Micrarchaeota archaeon]
MASFEDFEKLDIRVAKVLDAEPVEGAKKLYRLKVRVGAEERTLVAEIAEQYAPDEILGKKILVIANLEPKKIKGIESNGMLLAAVSDDQKKIVLCTVDEDVADGTKIM